MNSRDALLIFVKNAVLGKVKTRLAESVGAERALRIYIELLQHTRNITQPVECEKFVYFSSFIPVSDMIWANDDFQQRLQQGEDLGSRMSNAFSEVFEEGHERAVVIGSDCAELNEAIIRRAYHELEDSDIVIGPATDGGYYLLGMNEYHPELFENKHWSTQTVFDETIHDMIEHGWVWQELPMLSDVDTEEDLERIRKMKKQREIRTS